MWRYRKEQETLWRRIVKDKYGSLWGNWCANVVKGSYGVTLWKYIRQEGLLFCVIFILMWVMEHR